MRILIVCSGTTNKISPFVYEQAESLRRLGVEIDYFLIDKPGFVGYLSKRRLLIGKIENYNPDLIHAHYGLSGLLANLQRLVPVITTYHGSDINDTFPFVFSKIALILSSRNIFVSKKLAFKAKAKKKFNILSCGVDLENFQMLDKAEARKKLGLSSSKKLVLFSSHFNNIVKNYDLAKKSIELVREKGIDVELIEYKGYSRFEANFLFNAVDCVLVTSYKESGPLVIKEAMAVNTPAISVDVGDVSEVTNNAEGYYITSYNAKDIAESVIKCINRNDRTNARIEVQHLDLNNIAVQLLDIYKDVMCPSKMKN